MQIAVDNDKPVRIGVNWGSLDQDLLTQMMDENARAATPRDGEGRLHRGDARERASLGGARRGGRPGTRPHPDLGEGVAALPISSRSIGGSPRAATIRCISVSPRRAWG